MAPACFPIASTPVRAFGGLNRRITASYGTVVQPASGPPTNMDVPPGPTPHNSRNVRSFAPTWSIVRPAMPRNAPWAGGIPHGIPGVTYTAAVNQPGVGQTPLTSARRMNRRRPRAPIAQGRVTNQPRPVFFWKRQGGGGTPA